MNRIITVLLFLYISFCTTAQTYRPSDTGSKIHFIIKNFSINTGGDLSGIKGIINFNLSNLNACSFNVTVDVKTIDTDNSSRDEHLRSVSYFNAEEYPVIAIKSTKIDKTNKSNAGWYYFTGTLSMHGVTKVISFPFTATQQGFNFLFASKFEINRLDYGVGESSSVMSKTVKISLSVLAKKI